MLKVVFTCEHGGNTIPEKYLPLFRNQAELLNTHRAYDIGALPLLESLAGEVADVFFCAKESRLLVELNRSLHHPDLFSAFTRQLPPDEREELLRKYYFPYRRAVEDQIRHFIGQGNRVLHVSVHTFTPVLEGEERQADVGLLFDPARAWEKWLCERWRVLLHQANPDLVVRMNYPYLGVDDGLTTYLRTVFGPEAYAGIELEVNQKFFLSRNRGSQVGVETALRTSLHKLI
jgi:predicted N-formylglutamate amidohydrolase